MNATAVQKFHDNVNMGAVLIHLVYRYNVGVAQPGRKSRLLNEPLKHRVLRRGVSFQDLDRDTPSQTGVPGPEHDSRPAAPDERFHPVVAELLPNQKGVERFSCRTQEMTIQRFDPLDMRLPKQLLRKERLVAPILLKPRGPNKVLRSGQSILSNSHETDTVLSLTTG